MRLDEFTYVPQDAREKSLAYLANVLGHPGTDLDALYNQVSDAFVARHAAGELSYSTDGRPTADGGEADAVMFRTDFTAPNGEFIWGKCIANRRPGARHSWFGLFFEVPQPRRDGLVIGDLSFPNWHAMQSFLDDVARLAIPEKWTYSDYPSKQKTPILKSLIEQTFFRLREQGKLLKSETQMIFNTGLINVFFREIYVLSEIDPERPDRYINARPVLENERIVMESFGGKKPQMATFFSSIGDVVFDPDLEISTDDEHILIDNLARVPEEYRTMRKSQLFALFQSAIEFARIMARRNYKMIVPQYYGGRIQFLMPIYLSGEFAGAPDFALVLEKINGMYRGNTILTLDMAYQDARLIAKPDTTWLNPDNIHAVGQTAEN
ncbi:MAG: DUF3825 domain-containing protein [Chloroflexota bacterium]